MISKLLEKAVFLAPLLTVALYAQERIVSLDEAISIALENNNQLKVSQTAVEIAAAQYKQAMSANYPSLDLTVLAMRMDQAPTFEMRGTTTIDNTQMIGGI